ncbi:MAG TPA: serine/threonine-protein kinase, partial [Gemmatimonadales bacterium]|nr:serine/threonine-protein kinase [Gemmatimonadales bacterium]
QRETPSESSGIRPGQERRLPPDLLRQASRRLQILALIGSALWALGPGLGHLALYLTNPGDPRWGQFGPTDVVAAVSILIGLSLYGYLRHRDHDPGFIMNLALVYLIVCAAGIALMFHIGPPGVTPVNTEPTISWIGPVILMFAALVPGSPWKMLAAGFVAASMDPLGMVIAQEAGHIHYGAFRNTLIMHYPSYLLLGVAVVISHVVTRLGRQVAKERELGSYRLGELLGRGGMGEVYLATHRMLARPAAIKLIRPEVLAERSTESATLAITRFRREAEAAAKLRSPHTVELYDFGVTEDGTLYFVMELLQGLDLETLVQREGPLPSKRVIHILRQVCESLEEAHASGLVHRDIKPANIHVGRVGLRQDFVKVLDFGLVKSVGAVAGEDSMATAAGLTPGTPAYMAPEIALGGVVDGRADLYALGCVAYYLLTGRLVFEGSASFQVIAKHVQEAPLPPSQRTELDIEPALDQLVLSCLAKEPENRPQTAAELDRELQEIQTEPWSQEEAQRWWRQHQPA